MIKYLLLSTGLMLSPLWAVKVEASDFQIAVQRKTAAHNPKVSKGYSSDSKGSSTVFYQATVSYRSMSKPASEVEARYIILVERQRLGERIGEEKAERVRGTANIPALTPQEKFTFDTKSVELFEKGLSSQFAGYTNGGRTRSKDSIKGIWIKLFEGGQEVGEYINPTTLSNKVKWE